MSAIHVYPVYRDCEEFVVFFTREAMQDFLGSYNGMDCFGFNKGMTVKVMRKAAEAIAKL